MPSNSQIWRSFAKRQQRIEKSFIPKMTKAVNGEVKKITSYLLSHSPMSVESQMHVLFEHNGIKQVITSLWETSALSEANITYRELKKDHLKRQGLGFNKEWRRIVDIYLSDVEKFKTVEQINTTTKKRVLEIISKGIREGKSNREIVQDIENDDIPLKRAKLIVRTESVGAMNMGAMMGAMSTGIMYDKSWITAHDHNVRGLKPTDQFSHIDLEGQTVHIDKAYNNGEAIRYPGDKSSSPGNFCNCRCVQRFIARRDSTGKIMRYGVNVPNAAGGGSAVSNVFEPGTPQTSVLMQIIAATILGDEVANLFSSVMDDY